MEKPSTRQVTVTGIPSSARSRTSGYFILGELLGEVGGGTAEDLVLLLEQAVALLDLTQLGGLGLCQTGTHAVFDVRLLQPVRKRRFGDPEVLGDLGQWRLAFASHRTTSSRNSAG